MKSFVKIATSVVALSLAQQASADVTIRLTGSTAFRAAVHKSIIAMMGGDGATKIAHSGGAQTQSAMEGAGFATFSGSVPGITGTTYVQCSWSGSATGIASVATGSTSLNYIPTSSLPGTNGVATAALVSASAGGAPAARFAMSDVYQSATSVRSPALTNANVAIVPFVWVSNEGSTLTNMTAQQVRALYALGTQPRSMWTGNAADTDLVYCTGRDTGSGTRITALAETKYGITTAVNQWGAVATSGNAVTELRLWPSTANTDAEAVTLGGRDATAANGGYSSGGSVRNLMGLTSASVDIYDSDDNLVNSGEALTLVSYLGSSDAATAVTNGAVRLKYEGVDYDETTTGPAYIQEGLYTFWGYQHLYTSSLSTDEGTFRTRLITQLDVAANITGVGLRAGLMHVFRQSDGAVVGP